MTASSSDPSGVRPGSKRKREPVILDLKATEVAPAEAATPEESSLVDDPRTPAHPPEKEGGAAGGLTDDLPTAPEAPGEHTPTASEIEAAVAQLAPDAGLDPDQRTESATAAGVPPSQDIGEAPPPELAPGPEARPSEGAFPAGAAAGRPEERAAERAGSYADTRLDEPAPARRGGLGGLLAASLLGGAAGAALALAAERTWLKPPPPAAQQALPAAGAAPVDLGPLEKRLAALEAQQRDIAGQVQAAQSSSREAAQRAEEALKRPLAAAAPGAPAPAADPGPLLEPVNARIAALDDQLRGQVQGATQRLEQLDARLAEQGRQAAALAPQVAEQAKRLDAAAQQATQQAAEQGQRIAALGQQVAQQSQAVEALAKKLGERGPEGTAALRVVAGDRVLDALRDGAPFPQAMAALKRLNSDPALVAALEPFAASGAPTAAALAQEFRPLGERIVAEARGPATGWSDRFSRMAEGIVSIKPVGDAGSTTVPALVARIEDALARGDVAGAAAAFDALPEQARRGAEAFGRKLKGRAAAEDAARNLSNQALAALDASTR